MWVQVPPPAPMCLGFCPRLFLFLWLGSGSVRVIWVEYSLALVLFFPQLRRRAAFAAFYQRNKSSCVGKTDLFCYCRYRQVGILKQTQRFVQAQFILIFLGGKTCQRMELPYEIKLVRICHRRECVEGYFFFVMFHYVFNRVRNAVAPVAFVAFLQKFGQNIVQKRRNKVFVFVA